MPYRQAPQISERIEVEKIANIFNRLIAWIENIFRGCCNRIHNPFLEDTVLFLHQVDTDNYTDTEKANLKKLQERIQGKYIVLQKRMRRFYQPLDSLLATV